MVHWAAPSGTCCLPSLAPSAGQELPAAQCVSQATAPSVQRFWLWHGCSHRAGGPGRPPGSHAPPGEEPRHTCGVCACVGACVHVSSASACECIFTDLQLCLSQADPERCIVTLFQAPLLRGVLCSVCEELVRLRLGTRAGGADWDGGPGRAHPNLRPPHGHPPHQQGRLHLPFPSSHQFSGLGSHRRRRWEGGAWARCAAPGGRGRLAAARQRGI